MAKPASEAPQASTSAPGQAAAPAADAGGTTADGAPGAGGAVADWTPGDLSEAVLRVAEYGSKAVARAGGAAAVDGPAEGPAPSSSAAQPPPSPRPTGTDLAGGAANTSSFPQVPGSADRQHTLTQLQAGDALAAPRLAAVSADSALMRCFPGPPLHCQSHPLPPLSTAASLSVRDLPPEAPPFPRTESGRLMASDPVLAVPPGRTVPRPMTVLEAAQRRAAAVRTPTMTSPDLPRLDDQGRLHGCLPCCRCIRLRADEPVARDLQPDSRTSCFAGAGGGDVAVPALPGQERDTGPPGRPGHAGPLAERAGARLARRPLRISQIRWRRTADSALSGGVGEIDLWWLCSDNDADRACARTFLQTCCD